MLLEAGAILGLDTTSEVGLTSIEVEAEEGCTGLPGIVSPQAKSRSSGSSVLAFNFFEAEAVEAIKATCEAALASI